MDNQQQEQEKSQKQQQQPNIQDDLADALNGFDNEQLNVTHDDKSLQDDQDTDPQLQKEYDEFLKNITSGNQQQGIDQLSSMMQNLMADFANIPNNNGEQQPLPNFDPNNLNNMFGNMEDNPQFDELADHLLQQFMDKDILEEPLHDSKQKYQDFLTKNKDKLPKEEQERYEKQAKCIDQILELIEKDPQNKNKMIEKFEEMQEYGQPPEEILKDYGGKSPFACFTQQNQKQEGDDSILIANTQQTVQSIKKIKTIVVVDSSTYQHTHSVFFSDLRNNGYDLDFRAINSPQIKLMTYGEYNYDQMIIIASQPMDGKGLTKNKITDFFDSGRNVFIASDIDSSKSIRQLFNEFGVDLDQIGSSVIDHFNHADPTDHNQIYSNNIINQQVICPQLKYPVLYKGSGITMAPYEMNQVYGILRAEDTTYSYNYDSKEIQNTGNQIILVAGVQGRNNARAILTGSIEMFSNDFYKQEKFSNREFIQNIILWNFGETGILKTAKIINSLEGQSQKVNEYRVGDNCEYSIEIYIWNRLTNTWIPYVTDDITLEFIMLDPYVRIPLKNVQNTATYKAKFQVPEKHGIYKFSIKYEKPGFTFIQETTKVTVRPFKHNEFPRYLEQAYPYYFSTWATVIGFCVLVFYFLFHKD